MLHQRAYGKTGFIIVGLKSKNPSTTLSEELAYISSPFQPKITRCPMWHKTQWDESEHASERESGGRGWRWKRVLGGQTVTGKTQLNNKTKRDTGPFIDRGEKIHKENQLQMQNR